MTIIYKRILFCTQAWLGLWWDTLRMSDKIRLQIACLAVNASIMNALMLPRPTRVRLPDIFKFLFFLLQVIFETRVWHVES